MPKFTDTPTGPRALLVVEGCEIECTYVVDECDDEGGTEWLLDLVRMGGAWVRSVDALTTDFCMALQAALREAERRTYPAEDTPDGDWTLPSDRHSVINERGLVVVS